MNKIIIGLADKQIDTKPGFLLIDDGLVADTFLKRFERARSSAPTFTASTPYQ
jgi:hypothetical protein